MPRSPRADAQTASLTYSKDQIIWMPGSASRATEPCATPANGVGCLGATRNLTTSATGSTAGGVQLLLNNEYYGERVTTFDLKFAKNIRFSQKRLMRREPVDGQRLAALELSVRPGGEEHELEDAARRFHGRSLPPAACCGVTPHAAYRASASSTIWPISST